MSRRIPFLHLTWRTTLRILVCMVVVAMVVYNRTWISDALSLVRTARLDIVALSLGLIMASYLVSSQVLRVALHSLGHRVGVLRLWGTAIVAIVLSQSMPAGAVGSYAFLTSTLKRHGVPTAHAALVASLESLSYAGAMLLFFGFGLLYVIGSALASGSDIEHMAAPITASLVALGVIGGVALVLTRRSTDLTAWLLACHTRVERMLRRSLSRAWVTRLVDGIDSARALVAHEPRTVASLVGIQFLALSGHSVALLLVLWSLGATASLAVVFAAFSVALITSTFNILPGGGGTVETALVAALTQLSVGSEAIPAAIIFRLLNFWLLLPVAVGCYYWLGGRRRQTSVPAS